MRKRISITAAILVVLLGVGMALFWPRDEGPLYEGKTVRWWIGHPRYQRAQSVGVAWPIESVATFPKFDSNALPYIVRELERKDSRLKMSYMGVSEKCPAWIRNLLPVPIPAVMRKQNALFALGQFGPGAKPAMPAILRVINEGDTWTGMVSLSTLERLGTQDREVRAALQQVANSTNSIVSGYAHNVLHRDDYQMTPF